jgi:hypothetical protein
MRKNGILWGLLLIMGGILFLLDNLGFLPVSALSLFFPGILIVLGLWFLVGPLAFRQVMETRALTVPAEGCTSASIQFNHGAGEVNVTSSAVNTSLLEGTFKGGVDEKVTRNGTSANLTLSVPEEEWWGFPSATTNGGFAWDIHLNRSIAYALEVNTGASKVTLDLHDLIITGLKMSSGANDMNVTLPEQAGKTNCKFEFGSARLDVHVPQNVAAQIKLTGALLDTNEIDQTRFPRIGDLFRSPNYDSAANTVDIIIEAGLGKVSIH